MEDSKNKGNGAGSLEPKPKATDPPKSAPSKVGGAMAAILHQSKTRKRKGSLRKTALLGIGMTPQPTIHNTPPTPVSPVKASRAPYGNSSPASSNEHLTIQSIPRAQAIGSASTTDEDELPSPDHTPTVETLAPFPKNVPDLDGYFPPPSPRHLRPSAPRPSKSATRSPLASLPPSFPLPTPVEHSYVETAYWGWFILFVTWIVFVMGMGSCFGVWSWAWDVGETPYAPKELEDDPTLPIVGYYPCLIILTGIMAWVWVVVAWVGMKYFKHAKMGGDEG